MAILLWAAVSVMITAVIVTVHALCTAKDGIEDDQGFHALVESEVCDACGTDEHGPLAATVFEGGTSVIGARPEGHWTKSLWMPRT